MGVSSRGSKAWLTTLHCLLPLKNPIIQSFGGKIERGNIGVKWGRLPVLPSPIHRLWFR